MQRRKLTAKKEQFDPGATVEGSSGLVKVEAKVEIEDSGERLIGTLFLFEFASTEQKC